MYIINLNRYSVPVGKLISYHYQREWENMVIEGIYEKKKKEYEEKVFNFFFFLIYIFNYFKIILNIFYIFKIKDEECCQRTRS